MVQKALSLRLTVLRKSCFAAAMIPSIIILCFISTCGCSSTAVVALICVSYGFLGKQSLLKYFMCEEFWFNNILLKCMRKVFKSFFFRISGSFEAACTNWHGTKVSGLFAWYYGHCVLYRGFHYSFRLQVYMLHLLERDWPWISLVR